MGKEGCFHVFFIAEPERIRVLQTLINKNFMFALSRVGLSDESAAVEKCSGETQYSIVAEGDVKDLIPG